MSEKISPGCGLPRFDGDLSGGACHATTLLQLADPTRTTEQGDQP